jgi:predicted DNA-binding protein
MKQLNEIKTSIRLPLELKELLKFYSSRFRVTQSEFIRDSI